MNLQRAIDMEGGHKDRVYVVKQDSGETIGAVGLVDEMIGKRLHRRWLAVCVQCGPLREKDGKRHKHHLARSGAVSAVRHCKHTQRLERPLDTAVSDEVRSVDEVEERPASRDGAARDIDYQQPRRERSEG